MDYNEFNVAAWWTRTFPPNYGRMFWNPLDLLGIDPPKWSTVAALTKTRIPQVVSLLPLFGYALLWGEWLQPSLMEFPSLGPSLFFTAIERSLLLYMGSAIILFGLLDYAASCPEIVKKASSRDQFVLRVVQTTDIEQVLKARSRLLPLHQWMITNQTPAAETSFLGIYPSDLLKSSIGVFLSDDEFFSGTQTDETKIALGVYYDLQDRSNPLFIYFSLTTLGVGAVLFFLPGMEVFVMAALKTPEIASALFGRLT